MGEKVLKFNNAMERAEEPTRDLIKKLRREISKFSKNLDYGLDEAEDILRLLQCVCCQRRILRALECEVLVPDGVLNINGGSDEQI